MGSEMCIRDRFMTLQIKTSFDIANILIVFILPRIERSLWDHIFNVFFKDANLKKKIRTLLGNM